MVAAAEGGCSQTLLVSLWIRCTKSAVAQQESRFAGIDQKNNSKLPDTYASRQAFKRPLGLIQTVQTCG